MACDLANDLFTDTNGTDLTAHTMDTGSGWSADENTITIEGNKASTDFPDALYYTDVGNANCDIKADCTTADWGMYDGFVGFAMRWTDSNNLWAAGLGADSDELQIFTRITGTWTKRASTTFVVGATDTNLIEVNLNGDVVTCNVGATSINYTSSFNNSATKHGLYCSGAGDKKSQYENFEWDNFCVTALPGLVNGQLLIIQAVNRAANF